MGVGTAIPLGSTLLHIGPHKSGTTAVQAALHRARPALAEHGVRYAGEDRQAFVAAISVIAQPPGQPRHLKPDAAAWARLVEEIERAPEPRVAISSEAFSVASAAEIQQIVAALGAARPLHVVATLRPMWKIVPSQWQQFVQNGFWESYEHWLSMLLGENASRAANETFWRRHDHSALIDRWSAAVGPDNLTVVIVDDRNHDLVLRDFESLLGLPAGVLPLQLSALNRSLTYGEVELIRRINVAVRERGWPPEMFARLLGSGGIQTMKARRSPPVDEARIVTPDWALAELADLDRKTVERIRDLGVGVVGDLEVLLHPPASPPATAFEDTVAIDAAVLAVMAVGVHRRRQIKTVAALRGHDVRNLSTRELVRVIAARARRRVGRPRAARGPATEPERTSHRR